MFEASELDGWDDPALPRLADPELRSRVAGYLGHAPTARPGYRTDGVWVWPETLAERVRTEGIGPSQELLDHLCRRRLLLAAGAEPPSAGAEPPSAVADASPGPTVVEARGDVYRAAAAAGAAAPTDLLRLPHPSTLDGDRSPAWLSATGWQAVTEPPAGVQLADVPARELPPGEAAALADQLCAGWHAELLAAARESDGVPREPEAAAPRLARTYDGEPPAFSPNRLRILEPDRRDRLAAYLSGGRMVVRAIGRMPDPVTGEPAPVVPLSFRTDGVWVWQEALAYYLRVRGVAPELELLCHIEERAYTLPAAVPDELAQRAAAVATQPVPLRARVLPSYHLTAAGDMLRQRADQARPEILDAGLRWRRCPADWTLPRHGLIEISEAEAGQLLDIRWSQAATAASSLTSEP